MSRDYYDEPMQLKYTDEQLAEKITKRMEIKKVKFNPDDIKDIDQAVDSFRREIEFGGLHGRINYCIDEWIEEVLEYDCLLKA